MPSPATGYFRPGRSWLHRRDPSTKIRALLWAIVAAFVLPTPIAAALLVLVMAAAWSVGLLVPLLRSLIDGAGDAPQVKTFVIGQGVEDGGRVAPFRLDEGLRSWSPVAARALD